MKKQLAIAASVVSAAALAFAANVERAEAHHAFAAEFDADAPILLRGNVTDIEWVNPHTWIHLEAVYDDEEGAEPINWMVEGGTPNTLMRAGVNRNTLPIGTEIIVRGYQSKDRLCEVAARTGVETCKANGRDITFLDGRKLFMGSSGTGAPSDGADPTEGSGAGTLIDTDDLPTTSTRPYAAAGGGAPAQPAAPATPADDFSADFNRIDADGSGAFTLEEFTAFREGGN